MKKTILRYILVVLGTIFFWFLLSFFIHKPFVPSPFVVIPKFFTAANAKLAVHTMYSMRRIALSTLAAVLVGWPLGMLMGYFKQVDAFLFPLVSFIYPVPKIAFLPVIMLIFGLGEMSKIFTLFIVVVFQILVSVRDFIKSLDHKLFFPLIALDAKTWEIFIHIMIPASLGKLLSAIRIALATSLSILFFSETFGTVYGLGYYIMDSMFRINYVDMYCGILAISMVGIVLFAMVDFFEHLLINK